MTDRQCVRCKKTKLLQDFVKDSRLSSGYRKYCKSCRNFNFRTKYAEDEDTRRVVREQQKRYWASRTDKRHLLYAFGIDSEDFNELLEAQDYKCSLCNRDFTESLTPCVDHDHACCPNRKKTCGECIRGLLCTPCNGRLSVVEDSDWLEKAKQYLRNNNVSIERITQCS